MLRLSMLVAVGVVIVADSWFLTGTTGDVVYDLAAALPPIAVVAVVRRRRPSDASAWLLLAGGYAGWAAGDVIWNAYAIGGSVPPTPSIADGLYLAGYAVAAVGLALLIRDRTPRSGSLAEATIVAMGVGVLVWQFAIDPILDNSSTDLLARAVNAAYPVGDLALCLLLVRAFLAGALGARSTSVLGFSLIATMTSDIAYAAGVSTTGQTGPWLTAGWLAGYLFLGVAAVQRGGVTSEVATSRPGASPRVRLALLSCSGIVAPLTWVLASATHQRIDVPILSVATAGIFGLVMHRVARLLHALSDALERQRELSEQLDNRASHDALTGELNRPSFLARIDEALARGAGEDVCVAFIDLDGFKAINDGAGHGVGDELLVGVARRLRHAVRAGDVVARFGGDEFAVLLDLADERDLSIVGDRLVAAFADPFATARGALHVHASVGLATGGRHAHADELVADADTAMYAAKHRGKNRHVVYDDSLRGEVLERLALVEQLEAAMRDGTMQVHYQPIVDTATGEWTDFEALVRCPNDEGRLMSPAQFLDAAQGAGLMEQIDRYVLEQALADLATWRTQPGAASLGIAVNVSARALLGDSYERHLYDLLRRHGLPPSAVTIEITEDTHISDPERVGALLARVREHGCAIGLDDFGTGYSSLSYLERIPLDHLKVPMQFTHMLTRNERSRGLAESVIAIAPTVGLTRVIEGVETAEQWQIARELGCERAQGYLFARPMPSVDVEVRLAMRADSRTPAA